MKRELTTKPFADALAVLVAPKKKSVRTTPTPEPLRRRRAEPPPELPSEPPSMEFAAPEPPPPPLRAPLIPEDPNAVPLTYFACGGRKADKALCTAPGCLAVATSACVFELRGRAQGRTCGRKICAKHGERAMCPPHARLPR